MCPKVFIFPIYVGPPKTHEILAVLERLQSRLFPLFRLFLGYRKELHKKDHTRKGKELTKLKGGPRLVAVDCEDVFRMCGCHDNCLPKTY